MENSSLVETSKLSLAAQCIEKVENQKKNEMSNFLSLYKKSIDSSLLAHDFSKRMWNSLVIKKFNTEDVHVLLMYLISQGFVVKYSNDSNYYLYVEAKLPNT